MSDTLQRLHRLMCDVFGEEGLEVSRATTAADVPGWDSLSHVSLILDVETEFGVRFTAAQVADLQSVGELVDLINASTGGPGR